MLQDSDLDSFLRPDAGSDEPAAAPAALNPVSAPSSRRFNFDAITPDIADAFKFAAQTYGVDENVLIGIAAQESGFNPKAIGPVTKSGQRAVGLMQFMPDTAKRFGIDPTDPIEAIVGAAAYLRSNLDKFGGDYRKAIAGYNWGENRKEYDAPDWDKKLPKETTDYLAYVEQFIGLDQPKADPRKELPAGVTPSEAGGGRGFVNPPMADETDLSKPFIGFQGPTGGKVGKRDLTPSEPMKGVISGGIGLKQLWENNAVLADSVAMQQRAQALDLFNDVDGGKTRADIAKQFKTPNPGYVQQQAEMYATADAPRRSKMRQGIEDEIGQRKDFIAASMATIRQYQQEQLANKGRVDEFTDISNLKDFQDWLVFNGMSGLVSMAPLLITAATGAAAPLAAGAMGYGMAVGELAGDRVQSVEKTQGPGRFRNPDRQDSATPAANAAISKYVGDTAGSTYGAAAPFAALDVALGPVAGVIARSVAKASGKEVGRLTLKGAAKDVGKSTAEEFAAGGGQETIKIGTEVGLGEQESFATPENAKRVLNSAAAEAAGGLFGGAGASGARLAMQAPKPIAEKITDIGKAETMDDVAAAALDVVNSPVAPAANVATATDLAPTVDAITALENQDVSPTGPAGIVAAGTPASQPDQPGPSVGATGRVEPDSGGPGSVDTRPADSGIPASGSVPQSSGESSAAVEPAKVWYGRRGDGYLTPEDAQRGLGERQRLQSQFDWRIEPTPDGKYRLAGYAPSAATGTVQASAPAYQSVNQAPITFRQGQGGTWFVGGDPTTIRDLLKANGITNFIPTRGGVQLPANTDPEVIGAIRMMADDLAGISNEELKSEIRQRLGMTPPPKTPKQTRPFRDFLRSVGIRSDVAGDVVGESNAIRANQILPMTFRKNGLNLDALAERALEMGFLTQEDIDNPNDNGGVNRLVEMIQAESRGMRQAPIDEQISPDSEQAQAEKELTAALDRLGVPVSSYADLSVEQMNAMVNRIERKLRDARLRKQQLDVAEESRLEREAIQAADDMLPADLSAIERQGLKMKEATLEDFMRSMLFSEQEIQDELAKQANAAKSPQTPDEVDARGPQGSGQAGQGNPGGEGPRAEGQVSQDLLGDAPNASQQEANRIRQEREDRERQAANAAPAPDDFMLTGSNSPADRARAAGQMELGDSADTSTERVQKSVESGGGRAADVGAARGLGDSLATAGKANPTSISDGLAKQRGVVALSVYQATERPGYEGLDALTLDDADFEIESLQALQERGKLRANSLAMSEFGRRLDTSTIMALNEAIAADPTGTMQALRDSIAAKNRKLATGVKKSGESEQVAAQADNGESKPQAGFDSEAWDKARAERIEASREAGNVHLDSLPKAVEAMRGKTITYVHDTKERGRILTVDNRGNVYVEWLDKYSQDKEMASPMDWGKRKGVMTTSLGPSDLKDYYVVTARNAAPATPDAQKAEPTPSEPVAQGEVEKTREDDAGNVAMFSRGAESARGITLTQLNESLAAAFGKATARRLTEAGVMVPLADQTQLPAHVVPFLRSGDRVYGFYDKRTNKTYAVLDNLTPEMVPGLALHEIGVHYGFKNLLGDEKYNQVMKRLDLMVKAGQKDAKAARKEAEANAVNASQVPEETLGYLVQMAPEMGLVQEVIAKIKAFLFRNFSIGGSKLTTADLVMLAHAAVQHAARNEDGGVRVDPAWDLAFSSGAGEAQGDNTFAQGGTTQGVATNKDVAGKSQGGRSAGDNTPSARAALQIVEAMRDNGPSDYALRVVPGEFRGEINVGDVLPVSKQWDDGSETDQELRGTSVARIRAADEASVIAALRNLGATGKNGPNGYYYGDRILLVEGESVGSGEDVGESLFRDAKVIGLWKKPTKGLSEIQPNESTAPDSGGATRPESDDIRFARGQPDLFDSGQWDVPETGRVDALIQKLQDGRIDLKRAQDAIVESGRAIDEKFDARLAETLYAGRVAHRTENFINGEAKELLERMARLNVDMTELSDFLLARHAPERNKQIAKVNPDLPDGGAGSNSKGELMTTQAAKDYIAGLPSETKLKMTTLAALVDKITKGTRELLVSEGLESPDAIQAWEGAYSNYVPLFKDEAQGVSHPIGQGMSVRGSASRRATGSTGEVTNMLAHVLMQREAAITRAEKNRVGLALYGLALSNPNKDFWTTIRPNMSEEAIADELDAMGVDLNEAHQGMSYAPTIRKVDDKTGQVVNRPNPLYKSLPGAMVVRVNGEDRVLMFNQENERAIRLAQNLKNLDGLDIANETLQKIVGKPTRWIASVNTQYNPAFGLVNMTRDALGAMVNLSSTQIAGKQLKVAGHVPSAMAGIFQHMRGDMDGEWAKLYEQFQMDGGKTGFKEMFRTADERTKALQDAIDKVDRSKLDPREIASGLLSVLDGFNTISENIVRLSAYKVALDSGLSRAESARLARELTVDFNRKGSHGTTMGMLYAFFNASVQGTARTVKAIQGPAGKSIILGGLALGTMQALMLAAAGYDDDEIPEWVKARGFIIPLGKDEQGQKKHAIIPLPLGLHVLPNTGRVLAELALYGKRDMGEKVINAIGEIAGAFNPMGGANILTDEGILKTIAPTVLDPLADLATNTNFSGRKIEKDYRETDNRPGFQRAREGTIRTASGQAYISVSKAMNTLTGGTDYQKGMASPSPEQIRYVAQVVGGGLLREVEKVANMAMPTASQRDIKVTGIPLAGRFYGVADDEQTQSSRYYKNAKEIDKIESSMGSAKKAGDRQAMEDIGKDPRAGLIHYNNTVGAKLSRLNKMAVQTVNDRARTIQIDRDRTELMRSLNNEVIRMEEKTDGPNLAQRMRR